MTSNSRTAQIARRAVFASDRNRESRSSTRQKSSTLISAPSYPAVRSQGEVLSGDAAPRPSRGVAKLGGLSCAVATLWEHGRKITPLAHRRLIRGEYPC